MSDLQRCLDRIGGLSAPAKMPCHSWSIPASTCQLGARLAKRPGSTCNGCYALKGRYVMPNVQAAMARRFAILTEALGNRTRASGFVAAFGSVLNRKVRNTRGRRIGGKTVRRDGAVFRWHDSGDLQSAFHLQLIAEVAQMTPRVRHWLPTREVGHVHAFLTDGGELPSNLTVRLSVPMRDNRPTGSYRHFLPHSGVHTTQEALEEMGAEECIAYSQNGECRDCRACWDPSRHFISYALH